MTASMPDYENQQGGHGRSSVDSLDRISMSTEIKPAERLQERCYLHSLISVDAAVAKQFWRGGAFGERPQPTTDAVQCVDRGHQPAQSCRISMVLEAMAWHSSLEGDDEVLLLVASLGVGQPCDTGCNGRTLCPIAGCGRQPDLLTIGLRRPEGPEGLTRTAS